MAIGTTAAIIGASVIGAGASLASGAIGASAASSAGDTAAASANRAADLQYAAAQQTREDFEPFRLAGLEALNGDSGLMAFLGLDNGQGGPQAAPQQPAPYNPSLNTAAGSGQGGYFGGGTRGYDAGMRLQKSPQFDTQAYLNANPDVANSFYPGAQGFNNVDDYASAHWQTHGQSEGRSLGTPQGALTNVSGAIQGGQNQAQGGATGQPQNALTQSPTDLLRATPGYQFRFDEGMRAVNNQLSAAGLSNSGAAQRELTRVGQGYADQTYQSHVNNLMNVANIGTGSAAQISNAENSAAAGASNAIQAGGTAQANAALSRGSAYQNALGGVAGSAGWGLSQYGASQGWEGF